MSGALLHLPELPAGQPLPWRCSLRPEVPDTRCPSAPLSHCPHSQCPCVTGPCAPMFPGPRCLTPGVAMSPVPMSLCHRSLCPNVPISNVSDTRCPHVPMSPAPMSPCHRSPCPSAPSAPGDTQCRNVPVTPGPSACVPDPRCPAPSAIPHTNVVLKCLSPKHKQRAGAVVRRGWRRGLPASCEGPGLSRGAGQGLCCATKRPQLRRVRPHTPQPGWKREPPAVFA